MGEFIIFGVNSRAEKNMNFLKTCGLDHMVQAFCTLDKSLCHTTVGDKPVILWDEAAKRNVPFFLAAEPNERKAATWLLDSSGIFYSDNLIGLLSSRFGMDSTWLDRMYCKYYHEYHMDRYYKTAEDETDVFWGEDSPFYRMFSLLDLTDVVELACGHGRHVEKYLDKAGSVTLVDISEKNISYCKNRFSGIDNIRFYVNNGYDLRELKDGSYTAIFSYDSMVHFEMLDIYSYLEETRRILKSGGRALFHHSNLMIDPKQSFYSPFNIGGRAYMSKDLFAYLAYQAGLTVTEQQIIDWSMPEMDCITLVEKQ